MNDFFNLLPEIIIYLVGGYIYMSIYRFVTYKEKINDVENILLSSLTAGFVIKSICVEFNQNSNLVYILLCVALAYLFALLLSYLNCSVKFYNVVHRLRINRTINPNIWYDFLPPISKPIVIKLTDRDNKICYIGCCANLEENEHHPLIVLSRYRIQTINGEVLIDYSTNEKSCIILNTESFSSIERIINE